MTPPPRRANTASRAAIRTPTGRARLLPQPSRGVAEEIVDQIELDQLPTQQHSDLVR